MSGEPTINETDEPVDPTEAAIYWTKRWAAAASKIIDLLAVTEVATDLCWKATAYGTTEDGDVYAYIVPKGVVHRLVGALQGAGISASLRAFGVEADHAADLRGAGQ